MTAPRVLEQAIALRGVLMALLPPEVQAPMRAVYRLGLEAMAAEEEGLAETDGRVIRLHPERFLRLPPEEALYVLAHEILHAALDHPRRAAGILGWAEERVREAAARARSGIPPREVPPEEFRAWRAAWEKALGPDPWAAWEARIREVLPDLINYAADFLVNAWADLMADLLRLLHGRALLRAPARAARALDPKVQAQLLATGLEELFARFLRDLIAARPGDEGEALPEGAFLLVFPSRIPPRGRLPLPDGGAGRDLRPPEGAGRGEGEGAGEGDREAGPIPAPIFREGLRRILEAARQKGLLPGDLVERIFPRREVRLPWRQILRAWLRQAAPEPEADWTRRDPRVKIPGAWVPQVRDLPEGRGASVLLVARDVSGSMDAGTLGRISGEIQELAEGIPGLQALVVLDVDAGLQGLFWVPVGEGEVPLPGGPGIRRVRGLAEALSTARGRGGTVFAPVFRALRGEDPSPMGQALGRIARAGLAAGLIFFTDGIAHWPPPALRPPFPVLWVVPRRVETPFGAILEAPELFPGASR